MEENTPSEVIWAWSITGFVGIDTYNKVQDVIRQYPEYFPWDTEYNTFPNEVHEAYRQDVINTSPTIPNEPENSGNMFEHIAAMMEWWEDKRITELEHRKKLWKKHYGDLEFRE